MAGYDSFPSKLCVTGVKLNDNNYHQWAPTFETFVVSQIKEHHFVDEPPDVKVENYVAWRAVDATVVSWLLNSVENSIHRSYALVRPASRIWSSLQATYGNEHNVSRVCELWENVFNDKQGPQETSHAFFNRLKGLKEEIEVYQPPSGDIAIQRRICKRGGGLVWAMSVVVMFMFLHVMRFLGGWQLFAVRILLLSYGTSV